MTEHASSAVDRATNIQSLKTFIGAKDFDLSKKFYSAIGWRVSDLTDDLSDVSVGSFSFYLQSYYQKTWCDNTMMFIGVDDAAAWRLHVDQVLRAEDFGDARAKGPTDEGYALVTHLWDPSGVLWHIAQFK